MIPSCDITNEAYAKFFNVALQIFFQEQERALDNDYPAKNQECGQANKSLSKISVAKAGLQRHIQTADDNKTTVFERKFYKS